MTLATSSLFVFFEFIERHPGLLLVLIGVAGEIFCDWKEMGVGRLAKAKRISAILLVIGLMMEFWEAAKSDNEIAKMNLKAEQAARDAAASYENSAVAKKEAGEANERASNTESNNLVQIGRASC